ncbi:MAG: autotransporter domain-containing protein [Xanthobacteraceae bacterium]|nr:autotransporter domain-containing protein [Xanthobacteraceae bacterium]
MVTASTAVQAQSQFSTVFVFGDSLSDRGRVPGLILAQDPSFPSGLLFPKSPPYFMDRFSNGPTYAELLPGLIGVAPNPGQNFAVGGAETDTNNLANSDLSIFGVSLPGIRTEIDSFIGAGGRFQPSAAVVHFGGANDYFAFLDQTTPPTLAQVPGEVALVTGNIRSNIQALVGAGARTIIVPNVPDLAVTPSYRGTPLAPVADALSTQHAAALNAQMGGLARQLGVNIFVVDFATGLRYVLNNPSLFGFTNVTDACVTSTSSLPPYITPSAPCANPGQHLFWDDVHPTANAHRILAQFAADTLLAPQTIAAQAAFALTTGDNFLRRMQGAILWNGGVEHAPIFASAVVPDRADGKKVFFNVQRSFGNGNSGSNSLAFDYGVTQVSGGLVFQPWNNVTFGLIGGFDNGSANLDQARGSIGLDSFRFGAMAGYDNGALFAGTGVAISHDDYSLNRQTFVPQLRAGADTSGNTVNAFGAVGYRRDFGPITAGPLLALRYTGVRISGYSEQGAPGLDLIVETQRVQQLIGSAGIAAASRFNVGTTAIVPYVNLSVESNLLRDDRSLDTALVTVPNVVRILEIGQDGDVFGRLNGGIKWEMTPGIKGILRGETTFGRAGGNEHAVFATLVGRL